MKKLFVIAAIIGAAFMSRAQVQTNAPAQTVPAQFQPLIALLAQIPVVPYTNETLGISIGVQAGGGVAETLAVDYLPSFAKGGLVYAQVANNGSEIASGGLGVGYAVSGEYWQVSGRVGGRYNYAIGKPELRAGIEVDYQQLYAGAYYIGETSMQTPSSMEFESGAKFAF